MFYLSPNCQEASKRNNNWLPPPWAIVALFILGFNEFMTLLRYFLIIFSLFIRLLQRQCIWYTPVHWYFDFLYNYSHLFCLATYRSYSRCCLFWQKSFVFVFHFCCLSGYESPVGSIRRLWWIPPWICKWTLLFSFSF